MKLEQFEKQFTDSDYATRTYKYEKDGIKEERLYLEANDAYSIYFVQFEKIFVMKVFLKRPKDAPYTKQTEEENKKCLEAKFKLLNVLRADGIEFIEQYDSLEKVVMMPKKKKINLDL